MITLKKIEEGQTMVRIRCKRIEIEEVSNSSAIFSGDNHIEQWRVVNLSNEGFGVCMGNHLTSTGNQHTMVTEFKDQKGCSIWNEKGREN